MDIMSFKRVVVTIAILGFAYELINAADTSLSELAIKSDVIYSVQAPEERAEKKTELTPIQELAQAPEKMVSVSQKSIDDIARALEEAESTLNALSKQLGELKGSIASVQHDVVAPEKQIQQKTVSSDIVPENNTLSSACSIKKS